MTALLLVPHGPGAEPAPPPRPVSRIDFDRDVRPIFAAHCVSCHGSEKQRGGLRIDRKADALAGGDSGAAINPGKPTASPLLDRVASRDPAERMPPRGDLLTAAEVATLHAWVKQGAQWPGEAAGAAADHWSFKPVVRPPVPDGHGRRAGTGNPIDAFVRARLAAAELKPAPEADRRTLIRRLKFDLHGLPPTPEEVAAFQTDPAPDAYERLVETYLASPHYGERWARHWLDVVRFAESDGFEMNWERPAAWPYRDYVIRSFNEDKSFDRFVLEQLAGDAVVADEATGFLVGGPWDRVKSPDPALTAQQRADELHDMVGTTASAFLGLTVGCARCHNHKFDPVSQADYYRLQAVFAGVRHSERPWRVEETAKATAAVRADLTKADAALAGLEPLADPTAKAPRRMPVSPRANVERFAPVTAAAVRLVVLATNKYEPCLDELEVFAPGGRKIDPAGAALRSSGDYPHSPNIHRLSHLTDGKYGNGRSWISNQVGRGWIEIEFNRPVEIDRVVWGRDREGKFLDRVPTRYRIDVWTPDYEWVTVASSADRLPFGTPEPPAPPGLGSADREAWAGLTKKRDDLRRKLAELERAGMVYAGKMTAPDPTFRLLRGDPMQPREPVGPGVLAGFGSKTDIPADATGPQRRLALAQWVADPANPLTARVIVNRLWQYHFGTGIVDTPSDLGRNGGKPTHPELLDWLAAELVRPTQPATRPWSLKHLHRLIVTSATYRQSSTANPAGLAADAQARLLWRYPPRRLEAEAIRDSVLFVSGKLDLTPGGPGFSPFESNTNYVRVYTPKKEFGPAEFRRMVYMHRTRMQADDTFGAFDCPDGGQVAPRRNSSTTPLQALNLLNSPFMLRQAGDFADRVRREAGPDPTAQVRRAFRLAFQRAPSAKELAAAVELVDAHGLAALGRALLNANEFLYVD
ncbi:MAG TPA: PSD1 and planctomycete cytochrome C domain-containing protein [Gemmataceae bacterium]|nr:PSD1 and planctomycete cytochrome C domain-containing protein [Gemmataceae bacterium]